jgi:hypothetical protein
MLEAYVISTMIKWEIVIHTLCIVLVCTLLLQYAQYQVKNDL